MIKRASITLQAVPFLEVIAWDHLLARAISTIVGRNRRYSRSWGTKETINWLEKAKRKSKFRK